MAACVRCLSSEQAVLLEAGNSLDVLQAVILGAVQGLTEFIPISSSAHLIVIPWLFGWKPFGLAFDVALHLGTLVALVAYFWRDWYSLLKDSLATTRFARLARVQPSTQGKTMLLWPIVIASIPAAVAGKFLEESIVEHARMSFALVGIITVCLGILLMAADKLGAKRRSAEAVTMWDWLIIGLAQALAIIPGVSRSGITMTAGLACGLKRDASARFSFLLGAPIIFGAAVYELPKVAKAGLPASEMLTFLVGIVTSALVGYVCIGFLMSYLRTRSTGLFVAYRIVFGIGVILLSTVR